MVVCSKMVLEFLVSSKLNTHAEEPEIMTYQIELLVTSRIHCRTFKAVSSEDEDQAKTTVALNFEVFFFVLRSVTTLR